MTWKEFKNIVLAKIFASKNGAINADSKNNKDYTLMMPGAYNEGLAYIGNAARWYRKNVEIDVSESDKAQSFNISDYAYDFKELGDLEVFVLDDEDVPYPVDGASVIAGRLVIPSGISGTVVLYYNGEYDQITQDSDDDTELDVPSDILSILPLYVASQVYLEDDRVIALNWRSQFETALNGLKPNETQDDGKFYSTSGW